MRCRSSRVFWLAFSDLINFVIFDTIIYDLPYFHSSHVGDCQAPTNASYYYLVDCKPVAVVFIIVNRRLEFFELTDDSRTIFNTFGKIVSSGNASN